MRHSHPTRNLWTSAAVLVAALLVAAPSAQRGRARQAPPGSSDLRPQNGTLKLGDPAPDFMLASPDGKATVSLAAFRGKSPVALVFGSFT